MINLDFLKAYNKIVVGFSGGLDSTVLLDLLIKNNTPNILAVHINHQYSKLAAMWHKSCAKFCADNKVEFLSFTIEVPKNNFEAQARNMRYEIFRKLLKTQKDCVLTAHHANDQTETLLLNLFRGSGVDGLAATPFWQKLGVGSLLRPLITIEQKALQEYAKIKQLAWHEDPSNNDDFFLRNYLRHEIIPKIAQRWPKLNKNITQTAKNMQAARLNLEFLDSKLTNNKQLPIASLLKLPLHRKLNALKQWLKNNNFSQFSAKHLEIILTQVCDAKLDAKAKFQLNKHFISRYKNKLYIYKQLLPAHSNLAWDNFPQPLKLSHSKTLYAQTQGNIAIKANSKLTIKYRVGGEKILINARHKSLKKLFNQWEIPPWLRDTIPLLYINDELCTVIGYKSIADNFYAPLAGWNIF